MVKSLSNFFYGLTQRNFVARVRCAGLDVTSLSFHKEVTKKGNPDEPLGASSVCRSTRCAGEKDIFDLLHFSPHSHHERQIWKAKFVKAILILWSGWGSRKRVKRVFGVRSRARRGPTQLAAAYLGVRRDAERCLPAEHGHRAKRDRKAPALRNSVHPSPYKVRRSRKGESIFFS